MNNHLGEVGPTARVLAVVGLGLASAVLAALNILVVILLTDRKARAEIPGPLIGSGLLFGFLSLVSTWMLVRLIGEKKSSNMITMMPVWFIRMWGTVFGAGIVFAAIKSGQVVFLFEGGAIALSMILLPRRLGTAGNE